MEHLTFTITGDNLTPASFPLSEMIDILKLWQQSIAVEGGVRLDQSQSHDAMRLVSIQTGSATFKVQPSEQRFSESGNRIVEAYRKRDFSKLKPQTVKNLRKIHSRGKDRGAKAFILGNQRGNVIEWPADVDIDPPDPNRTLRGETDLYVTVVRVGGKKPRAGVELLGTKEQITVDLQTPDQAQVLASYLYRQVVLRGTAQWTMDDEIMSFEVSEIVPPIEDAPKALADLLQAMNGGRESSMDDEWYYKLTNQTIDDGWEAQP